MKETNQSDLKFILLSVCSEGFMYLCAVSIFRPLIVKLFGSVNIPSLALSILFCLILCIISRNKKIKLSKPIIITAFLCLACFLLISYGMENKVFASAVGIEGSIPKFLLYSGIILLCLILLFIIQKFSWIIPDSTNNNRLGQSVILLISILLTSFSTYNFYNINFNNYTDTHHLHAYFNSISNIFWKQPFSDNILSIYGHYAFFYYPILKFAYLFGINNILKVYLLTNCLLVGIITIIWIKILCWNIKNRIIQFLGIISICRYTLLFSPIYHQLYPLRAFPIAITALLISIWYRTKSSRFNITIIGYIVCTLLIIWNTETGLFSLISWSSLHICSHLQAKQTDIKIIVLFLFLIPLSFSMALLLCGLLNMKFGGNFISIQDFIFPLLSHNYMVDTLEYPLPSFPSAWMSIMFILFSLLCYGIKSTKLYSNYPEKSDFSSFCFAFSVLGIGTISYAINRPAYGNFYIVLPLMSLFIALTADLYRKTWTQKIITLQKANIVYSFKYLSGLLCFFILFILSLSTVINSLNNLKYSAQHKDETAIIESVQWMSFLNKKHDAAAIGASASLIYAYEGWDPGIYYMDLSDIKIAENFSSFLKDSIKTLKNKNVFISDDAYQYIPEEFYNTHKLYNNTEIGSFRMRYYVTK